MMERLEPRMLLAAELDVTSGRDLLQRQGAPNFAWDLPTAVTSEGQQFSIEPAEGVTNGGQGANVQETWQTTTELVVIDGGIDNHRGLLEALALEPSDQPWRQIEVIVLDPSADGIAQISGALSDREGISGVHILSHGSEAAVRLGQHTAEQRIAPAVRK